MNKLLMAVGAVALISACTPAETPDAGPSTAEEKSSSLSFTSFTASGEVIDSQGSDIGTIDVQGGPNGTVFRIALNEGSLTPGWHGLHLHAQADCSDVGKFTVSGGHVGRVEGGHGFMNPDGPENGDLPNIWVAADGSAGYEAFSMLINEALLVDGDGSALIIHENPDDFITQPIGGAGARVACAEIR